MTAAQAMVIGDSQNDAASIEWVRDSPTETHVLNIITFSIPSRSGGIPQNGRCGSVVITLAA